MVRVLVRRLSQSRLRGMGGAIAAAGLFSSWEVMIANFALIGFGFYMLHGCIQVHATEIAPDARGAAVSFHSFFFLGQAISLGRRSDQWRTDWGSRMRGCRRASSWARSQWQRSGCTARLFSATGAGFREPCVHTSITHPCGRHRLKMAEGGCRRRQRL
jgi:hypothetical protein